MPDNVPTQSTENDANLQNDSLSVPVKRSPIKRLGCGFLLVIWFTLLLSPCALFYLAANGEIRIWHSDIPEPHAHPRLLIELVSEVDYRGLRFERSFFADGDFGSNATCVQTNVSYLLWESIEENQDASFCDCYTRDDTESIWTLSSTTPDQCSSSP